MVLSPRGGAVTDRPTRRRGGEPGRAHDTGAQTLEFALVLPALALVLVVVVQTAVVGLDVIRAHHLARDAARAAVIGGAPADVPAAEVQVSGPDRHGLVTATARIRSRGLTRIIGDVWIPARATMVAEP